MRSEVPKLGLQTHFRDSTLRDIARKVVKIAEGGLKRRARFDAEGEDERRALAPLIDTVEEGVTPADRLLAAYAGPWQGDIDRIFEAEAL